MQVDDFSSYFVLFFCCAPGCFHDISDNRFAGEPLLFSLIGDVIADGYVGIDDIHSIAARLGRIPPIWDSKCPNCDLNDDDYIGIDDTFEAAVHFGSA